MASTTLAGRRADVEQLDARAGLGGWQTTLQRRHDRQTVEQVLHEHLPRIPDGSQVVMRFQRICSI